MLVRISHVLPLIFLAGAFLVIKPVPFNSDDVLANEIPAVASAWLMEGTQYETPLYVLDGRGAGEGKTLLVLAGVHGNEPAGPRAADILARGRVRTGVRLLVVPRANSLALAAGVRSTPEIGDLNRVYGATADELPMTQMAKEITDLVPRYGVDAVIDLHESWEPYSVDGPDDGGVDTAALGQTISADASQPSASLAERLTARANDRLPRHASFGYFEFPAGYVEKTIVPLPPGVEPASVSNLSSFYLAQQFPGVASLLVEVSQQQPVEQRVLQDLVIVEALIRELEEG